MRGMPAPSPSDPPYSPHVGGGLGQPVPPPLPAPLPSGPVDYVGLTRPGRRWWRLPLSLLIFVALFTVSVVVVTAVFVIIGAINGWNTIWFFDDLTGTGGGAITPGVLLYSNLILACLIPTSVISTRLGQGIRSGYVHSVAGRFRWHLFGQVSLLLLPLWALYLVIPSIMDRSITTFAPHPQLWAFLAVCWLTSAFQAAGEEYAFRGWLLQNLGGIFAIRILGWVAPVALSAILFGLAHGSLDPWVLGSMMTLAVAAGVLTWRTGGLEAAVSLHALNNILIMHLTLFQGGFDDAFVDTGTTGTFPDFLFSVIAHAAAVALVWWWVRRQRIPNTTIADPYVPQAVPAAPQPINSA